MSARWFTCTPVAFGGGADFFARDSGLLCRGFQAVGIESLAVMPYPSGDDDEKDLLRTDPGNLRSAKWWKAQRLDGVVLYAWGSPKYRKIARAIRQSGTFLVLNQDNGGLVSPLVDLAGWLTEQRTLAGNFIRFLSYVISGLTRGILRNDPLRANHLRQGDVIACVSPLAASRYRKLCKIYGGRDLANRVATIPHSVEMSFVFVAGKHVKKRKVTCVGRWVNENQKRPELLINVIGGLLDQDASVEVEIVGLVTEGQKKWYEDLADAQQDRVRLHGHLGRENLVSILQESQVYYCPSSYESFNIAAGEALCCGCSVVAGKSVSMASFEWFVEDGCGALAEDHPEDHLKIIKDELDRWGEGNRDPKHISRVWSSRLHANRVADRILKLSVGAGVEKYRLEKT